MNKRKDKPINYRESQLIIPKILNLIINSQQIKNLYNINNKK